MTCVENTLGNIFIKYNDKWRGNYYLKDDLTFTTDRATASRFYLLKSGDTTIINGDRISINLGNRTLMIGHDCRDCIRFIDRDQFNNDINSFTITNGSDNTDPITYETPIYLISDKNIKMALKYEWSMDLIETSSNDVSYRPHDHPQLVNINYQNSQSITSFQFYLEKADSPITKLSPSRTIEMTTSTATKPETPAITRQETAHKNEILDGYKGAAIIILLMIILLLCISISK